MIYPSKIHQALSDILHNAAAFLQSTYFIWFWAAATPLQAGYPIWRPTETKIVTHAKDPMSTFQ